MQLSRDIRYETQDSNDNLLATDSDDEGKYRMKHQNVKFKLSNPGMILIFDGQAEVSELL